MNSELYNDTDTRSRVPSFLWAIVLCGALVYSALVSSYLRFYGELGIDPSDVGLDYWEIVADSVGLVLIFSAIVVVLLVASRRTVLAIGILCLFLLFITLLQSTAGGAANALGQGRPVKPLQAGPLHLAISAYRAEVTPLTRQKEISARFKDQRVFFLGEDEGIVIFYTAPSGQTVPLPSSSLGLAYYNCNVSEGPFCKDVYDPIQEFFDLIPTPENCQFRYLIIPDCDWSTTK